LNREVDRVLQDVLAGFISQTAAHDEYGVVVQGGEIDLAATRTLRVRLNSQRHT
jgi:N-methylhydantoinase B